jgi:hypothetical protein
LKEDDARRVIVEERLLRMTESHAVELNAPPPPAPLFRTLFSGARP